MDNSNLNFPMDKNYTNSTLLKYIVSISKRVIWRHGFKEFIPGWLCALRIVPPPILGDNYSFSTLYQEAPAAA